MSTEEFAPFTPEEMAVEGVTALPDKEVISILDLAADVDLAIDGAAPIDLAVALNANIMAPIAGAVSANLLSDNAHSQALANQATQVNQTINADAIANGIQHSNIDQSGNTTHGTTDGATQPAAASDSPALVPDTTVHAANAPDAVTGGADSGPVDGSLVVDPAGHIVGTLDDTTGNVVDAAGHVVGTLNDTTGLVMNSAGDIVGSVTDLVDGASVANSAGQVIGVLDGATGNVVDASGHVVGVLDPLTGQVLNTVGDVLGTVTNLIDGTQVTDAAGNVIGVLDGATGNVVDAAGNVVGALDPLTGHVLDAAGNIIGTLGNVLNDVTNNLNGLNTGDLLKGNLLNVDVNVNLDANLAAPINGGVAANANVAAPIDASVSANILSNHSDATAMAQQSAIINQSITGQAVATSDQTSAIGQGDVQIPSADTASTGGTDSAPVAPAAPADPAPADTTTAQPAADPQPTGDVSTEPSTAATAP